MTRKIEITFECNQDWGQMKISRNGRYCELCSKTVHDFSDKSNGEILRLGKGDLCGMFLAEQIESDLRPIEFPLPWRTALLTIGTVLGLELNQVQGQDLNKGDKIENITRDTIEIDTSVVTNKGKQIHSKKIELNDCEKVNRPVSTRYYFSKRFPFIVKRRIRTVGRYRI